MIKPASGSSAIVQQLERLRPKRLPKNVTEEIYNKLPEAQRLAIEHAQEKAEHARRSSQQTLERLIMYERLAEAAIRRGDTAAAERAARQAQAAATLTSGNSQVARTAARQARTDTARNIAEATAKLEQQAKAIAQRVSIKVRKMETGPPVEPGQPVEPFVSEGHERLRNLAVSYGNKYIN